MDVLTCILADDEPLAMELLESLVRAQGGIEILAICRDGREALAAIRQHAPDMAFLDIEMPGLDGFDVIKRLQPECMPAIVFTTAYNQYAIDAFNVHAVDYVMKPLNRERLAQAIERTKIRLAGQKVQPNASKASIMNAIGQMSPGGVDAIEAPLFREQEDAADADQCRLLIRDAGKTHIINPVEIEWVDAAGDYMCIHVGSETVVARSTMKALEAQLSHRDFARVHRSTLVNVLKVHGIENLGKGDCILHLESGARIKASRNYRSHLIDLLALKY